MIIAYCIFAMGILALATWIYQGILLPSFRQCLRFKLFRLRDQTRNLVIVGKLKEDSAVFNHLHGSLNVLIKAVPGFDFAFVSSIDTDNPAAKDRVENIKKLFSESIPEVQEIFDKAVSVMAWALIANSLFWFNWILLAAIPIAIPQGIWKLCTIVFEKAERMALPAFELRERDLEESTLGILTLAG